MIGVILLIGVAMVKFLGGRGYNVFSNIKTHNEYIYWAIKCIDYLKG